MKFNELLEKYKEMPPVKRLLFHIMPVATVLMFALMTAPHSPSSVRDVATLTASSASDCNATRMRVSIFGRSLISYDWQSGNCPGTAAKPPKVTQWRERTAGALASASESTRS
jgi:hypothetical protein